MTVASVICACDSTQLSNLSNDRKTWLDYLTIGNLKSAIPKSPRFWLLNCWCCSQYLLNWAKKRPRVMPNTTKDSTHFTILEEIFNCLQCLGERGRVLQCADGHQRLCLPIHCASIADLEEHNSLHNIKSEAYTKWEVDWDSFGDLKQYAQRKHDEFQIAVKEYFTNPTRRHLSSYSSAIHWKHYTMFSLLSRRSWSVKPAPLQPRSTCSKTLCNQSSYCNIATSIRNKIPTCKS